METFIIVLMLGRLTRPLLEPDLTRFDTFFRKTGSTWIQSY